MIKLEIKKRDEMGQWKHLNVGVFAGKTLQEVFVELDDKEVVIEFQIDGKHCFFCGNEYWLERMKNKGPAVTFDAAINRLRDIRPELLKEIIPATTTIEDVFPGAQVESVNFV